MSSYPLHVLINDFALRSFRDTADRDYVHARLAYRARLIPQFLWSSLHALEKYTKCILLLNRISAIKPKKIGHEVFAGLERLSREGKFEISLSETVQKFVERLEDGAKFRYFEVSYDNREFDIARLDRAVWEIRRYCQPLDYDDEVDGGVQKMLQANLSQIRNDLGKNVKGTCVNHGWLESVIANKKHFSREPLLWNNLYFGSAKRKSVRLVPYWEAGNAPLFLYPEILDEIIKYVHLPQPVVESWREYLANSVSQKSQ